MRLKLKPASEQVIVITGAAKFLSTLGTLAPRTWMCYLESTAFKRQKPSQPNDRVDALACSMTASAAAG